MTAEEYARAQALMCETHPVCKGCPIADISLRKLHQDCMETRIFLPTQCVEAVERWWAENKHRFPQREETI